MFIQSIKYDKEYDRGHDNRNLVITIKKPGGEHEDHKFTWSPKFGELSKLFYTSNKISPDGHYYSKFVAKFRDSENVPNVLKKAIEFLQTQKTAEAAK